MLTKFEVLLNFIHFYCIIIFLFITKLLSFNVYTVNMILLGESEDAQFRDIEAARRRVEAAE